MPPIQKFDTKKLVKFKDYEPLLEKFNRDEKSFNRIQSLLNIDGYIVKRKEQYFLTEKGFAGLLFYQAVIEDIRMRFDEAQGQVNSVAGYT